MIQIFNSTIFRKFSYAITAAFTLFLAGTAIAFAQTAPPDLPDSAVQFAEMVRMALVGLTPVLAGLMGERVVHFIKKLPWLDRRERDKNALKKLTIQVFGVFFPIFIGWGFAYIADLAEYLDLIGAWPVIVMAWPVAHAVWFLGKRWQTQPLPPFPSPDVALKELINNQAQQQAIKSDLYSVLPSRDIAINLIAAGYVTVADVARARDIELMGIPGIANMVVVKKIREYIPHEPSA